MANKKSHNLRSGQKQPHFIILGSSGLVGSFVLSQLKADGLSCSAPSEAEVDILNPSSIDKFLKNHKNAVIVNFAAETRVDVAETQKGDKKASAWLLNVKSVRSLAKAASKFNCFLIGIGTDFEFTGDRVHSGPYPEDEPPHAQKSLSWYGATKAQGLKALLSSQANAAWIRIAFPYGNWANPRDFSNKLVYLINNKLNIVRDQYITPTYLPDLHKAIRLIADKKLPGIYHVASPRVTTWLECAQIVSKHLNLQETKISQITFKKFSQAFPTPRPQYGGLQVNLLQKLGISSTSVDVGLGKMPKIV